MKRKFKLFATVASLCLSVALMAFGVYAASTVTYTVTGSVSFAAQLDVTWTAQVAYGDGSPIAGKDEGASFVVSPTTPDGTTETWEADTIAFDTAENHDKIVFTFKCVNEGSQAIAISIADTPTWIADVSAVMTAEYKETYGTTGTESAVENAENLDQLFGLDSLAANSTYIATITLTLTDETKTLTQQTFNFGFVTETISAN